MLEQLSNAVAMAVQVQLEREALEKVQSLLIMVQLNEQMQVLVQQLMLEEQIQVLLHEVMHLQTQVILVLNELVWRCFLVNLLV